MDERGRASSPPRPDDFRRLRRVAQHERFVGKAWDSRNGGSRNPTALSPVEGRGWMSEGARAPRPGASTPRLRRVAQHERFVGKAWHSGNGGSRNPTALSPVEGRGWMSEGARAPRPGASTPRLARRSARAVRGEAWDFRKGTFRNPTALSPVEGRGWMSEGAHLSRPGASTPRLRRVAQHERFVGRPGTSGKELSGTRPP